MPSQLTSVRLDESQLERLRLLAEVDSSNVAQIIRQAIDFYADAQFRDPAFQTRVDEANASRSRLLANYVGQTA